MALKQLVIALSMIAGASPASAAIQDSASPGPGPTVGAPAGSDHTLYCMHIEAVTGTRLERVKCWTRAQWAENGVDIDKDWAKEGVSTIG